MKRKRRILIVDDDAGFVEALSVFPRAHGFSTLSASDGDEGLKLARMERPDLVTMEFVMSERTESCFAIREKRRAEELRNLPVFVLSSLDSMDQEYQIQPKAGWLAHDEFNPKPPDMTELLGEDTAAPGTD